MSTVKKLAKIDKTVGKATKSARKTTNGCALSLAIIFLIIGAVATYYTNHWYHNDTATYIVGGISLFIFLGISLFAFVVSIAVGLAGDGADKLAKYVAKKIKEKFLSKVRAQQLANELQVQGFENKIAEHKNSNNFNSVSIGITEIATQKNDKTYVGLMNDEGELVSYYEVEYEDIDENFERELQNNELVYL